MFSFNSFRCFTRRSVFFLFVLFCLSGALLFTGCSNGSTNDTGFIPEGVWVSEYDSYTITKTTVDYDAGYGSILKGTIEKPVTFSANAGVLIIKVTEVSGYFSNTIGRYTGVYYSEFKKSSIKLANAIDPVTYDPIEADSLSAAEALFTVDKVGDHVKDWGIISPYIKQ